MFHTYLIHLTQSIQATWLLIRRQETNDNAAFVFLFDFIFHNVMCSVDSDLALELHKFWIRLIIISLRSVREADRGGQSWCWFHLIVSSLQSLSSELTQMSRLENHKHRCGEETGDQPLLTHPTRTHPVCLPTAACLPVLLISIT